MKANKSLRILHLVHDSRRTGVPVFVSNMVRALANAGLPCDVCFSCHGELAVELSRNGTIVMTGGPRIPGLWRFYRFFMVLRLGFLRGRYDLLHIHSLKLAHLVPVAKVLGCKVIFHIHEIPRRLGPVAKLACRMADCVSFCSNSCAEPFSSLPIKRREVLLNAIFLPQEIPSAPHQEIRIVELASINYGKGQDLLIRAFHKLNCSSAKLEFYGPKSLPISYFNGLQSLVGELGLEDSVKFMGATARPFETLGSADIVVLPSRNESFGLTLVEALALGKPVIAHDLGGMREVVADGVTGFLVPCGDTDALVAKLDYLIAHPEVRRQMGKAGRQRAAELFDIEKRVPEYLELYRELCPN